MKTGEEIIEDYDNQTCGWINGKTLAEMIDVAMQEAVQEALDLQKQGDAPELDYMDVVDDLE